MLCIKNDTVFYFVIYDSAYNEYVLIFRHLSYYYRNQVGPVWLVK